MSTPPRHLAPLAALLLLATLLLATPLGAPWARAADRPPTLDPTYGLPLPRPGAPVSQQTAQWIWADKTSDNQTILLRRTFSLPDVPKSAVLYVTADDFFTLFVNGKEVDRSQADPKDGNVWQHVHRVDVAPYLTAGANILAIRAVNVGSAAGVVARLEVPGQAPIETGAGWKVFGDATPPADWTGAAFDDSAWRPATVIAPLTGGVWVGAGGLTGWPGYDATVPYLAHRTLPFAHVADVHLGSGSILGADGLTGRANAIVTVSSPAAGAADPPSLLLDFGQEIAGRVRIAPMTAGTVLVGTGESREEAEKSPWGGMHRLDLTAGADAFTPYSAFRYARLVFPAGQTRPVRFRVAMDHKYYPVEYKGSFSCSDPLLTRLWYTGAYTAHLCMQEDIWDAPKRDRARWIGDLHVSGEVINNAFADKFLMEQTLTRLRDAAQGGKPDTELPNTHVNDIPGYSCAWICCLADFHRHVGDAAFLAKQHDRLLSLLE